MKIIGKTGNDKLASVYIAQTESGKLLEFVESVPPPFSRSEKWVLIISTLFGCPVKCKFCDAGNFYSGKPSAEELFSQIDYLIKNRFGGRSVPTDKFKIQFSRMGEPSFNPAVLEVLQKIPNRYDAPGFYPSLSTIAPKGSDTFFEDLIKINNQLYKNKFQFQFSIHTTDLIQRDQLIPIKKWSFEKMAAYGIRFHKNSDQKVTLNFALSDEMIIEPQILLKHFNPANFIIKITPVNPTFNAQKNNLTSSKPLHQYDLIDDLRNAGYEVIESIGDLTENEIGSNCGQHVMNYLHYGVPLENSYTYALQK